MDDLIPWFGEQLDEDEQAAQAAGEENGHRWDRWNCEIMAGRPLGMDGQGWIADCAGAMSNEQEAEYVARHDPARSLREIEADRQLVTTYEEAREFYRVHTSAPAGELHGLLTAIRLRVYGSYADRPGYRDEWRP